LSGKRRAKVTYCFPGGNLQPGLQSFHSLFFLVLANLLGLIIPVLLSVAFLTVFERKLMAAIQRRRGPDKVGFIGLLQAIADAGKLLFKEIILPRAANKILLIFAPVLSFGLALAGWSLIPFGNARVFSDAEIGLLIALTLSSYGTYGILYAGWASNSRYALLGALRSAAQMVSYEVSLGLIMINVVFFAGSLNFQHIGVVQEFVWGIFPFFPAAVLFLPLHLPKPPDAL